MSNITNTCLYQACTKITNIPSQDMCLNHVPKHVLNHQPVPYQHQPCTTTMYHMHQTCTKHVPNLYQIMHQSCTKPKQNCTIPCTKPVPNHASTKTCAIPCANTISCINYVSHHASMSPRNASYIYQKCISNNVPNIQDAPQTMCLNHIPYHS
jgi:hypothetical protein